MTREHWVSRLNALDHVGPSKDVFARALHGPREGGRVRERSTRLVTASLALAVSLASAYLIWTAFLAPTEQPATDPRPGPVVDEVDPSFVGVWPARSPDALRDLAARGDTGWLKEPRAVAERFSAEVLGWSDVEIDFIDPEGADYDRIRLWVHPIPPTCLAPGCPEGADRHRLRLTLVRGGSLSAPMSDAWVVSSVDDPALDVSVDDGEVLGPGDAIRVEADDPPGDSGAAVDVVLDHGCPGARTSLDDPGTAGNGITSSDTVEFPIPVWVASRCAALSTGYLMIPISTLTTIVEGDVLAEPVGSAPEFDRLLIGVEIHPVVVRQRSEGSKDAGPPLDGDAVALWPERTRSELEAGQARIDEGADPWRTVAVEVVWRFARDVLGWSPDVLEAAQDVRDPSEADPTARVFRVRNTASGTEVFGFAPEFRPLFVSVNQLGRRETGGAWSVTMITSDAAPAALERAEDLVAGEPLKVTIPKLGASLEVEAPACDPDRGSRSVSDGYPSTEGQAWTWIGLVRPPGCEGNTVGYAFAATGTEAVAGNDPILGARQLIDLTMVPVTFHPEG